MSVKLDPREVLQHLNELGYCNISAQQLKEFMRDLKKLMKYDLKKVEKENIPVHTDCFSNKHFEPHTQTEYRINELASSKRYYETQSRENNFTSNYPNPSPVDAIFTNLYEASTVSSRAKSENPRIPGVSFASSRKTSNYAPSEGSKLTSYYTETDGTQTESCSSYRRTKSPQKPKSFIRPGKPLRSCKSDPVALYHQYQAEWRRQKAPGEDSRKDLRWAVREKMLSAPSIPYFDFIITNETLEKYSEHWDNFLLFSVLEKPGQMPVSKQSSSRILKSAKRL